MGAVQRDDQRDVTQPRGHVGARIPGGEAVRALELRVMRLGGGVERRCSRDAPGGYVEFGLVLPALRLEHRLDAIPCVAGLEVEALGAYTLVERRHRPHVARRW